MDEVLLNYGVLQAEFPNAVIQVRSGCPGLHQRDHHLLCSHWMQASTFDKFAAEVLSSPVYQQLPVVTSEIGDTWIHGVASDPIKV